MAKLKDSADQEIRPIKTILISQPEPNSNRSPFYDMEVKWGLKIDWRPFIQVDPVTDKEFRKYRIKPDDFTAIIFTSKNSIDHFFRICEDMRITMPASTKYFCQTNAVANYLQKFIVYRKRKVFVGVKQIEDLHTYFMKHKENEKFLLPTSNLGSMKVVSYLNQEGIEFKEVMMYKTVACDLSDLSSITYDLVVFFNPLGITSLYENFPEFKQKDTRIAVFGEPTERAAREYNLKINILAPSETAPSMKMAIEEYLEAANQ
jgi:uroporphyrinogen-III synthase